MQVLNLLKQLLWSVNVKMYV